MHMSVPAPLQADDPEHIGGYRLLGRLGRGGQGVVYLADSATGTRVAVKLMHSRLDEERARRRFAAEVAAVRRVAPFCTAQVLDADLDGDRPYIVSEYVEGISLQEHIAGNGPLSGGSLDRIAVGTATALVAVHGAGVVHRDFKPANVLLGPDGPRVIDFGISRTAGTTTTSGRMPVGTPAYLSPEQLKGERAGPAADMFGWALTIAFAASGRHAYAAESFEAILGRILFGAADLDPLSGRLREIVVACLAEDPADRPAAEEVLRRLIGTAAPGGPADRGGPGDPAGRDGDGWPAALGGERPVAAALKAGTGIAAASGGPATLPFRPADLHAMIGQVTGDRPGRDGPRSPGERDPAPAPGLGTLDGYGPVHGPVTRDEYDPIRGPVTLDDVDPVLGPVTPDGDDPVRGPVTLDEFAPAPAGGPEPDGYDPAGGPVTLDDSDPDPDATVSPRRPVTLDGLRRGRGTPDDPGRPAARAGGRWVNPRILAAGVAALAVGAAGVGLWAASDGRQVSPSGRDSSPSGREASPSTGREGSPYAGRWTGVAEHPAAGRVFPVELSLKGDPPGGGMRWGADLRCSGRLTRLGDRASDTVFRLDQVRGAECYPGRLELAAPAGDRLALSVTRADATAPAYSGHVNRVPAPR
ncbi:hypothetical protein Sru01_43510 [Sphaerisporangium rufum]|uniref:Protein kinase domain-containing protein n=1 Tax=Sphaerisporangium rufum TaxID=1381558 RepID=A0A919R4E9_9ACTN|nr:serine/threonine-protein kinase [Sphaerisporangium rufum]GII79369.1 hypothetical protein Sru01_43510 [Sphaerisporangium rufum]